MVDFKKLHTFEKRVFESSKIRERYPKRVPIVVEANSQLPQLDKNKYLVPHDFTVGQFVYILRKRMKLDAEKALFLFVDNVLPTTSAHLFALYNEKRDRDGFLYIKVAGENTYGLKNKYKT